MTRLAEAEEEERAAAERPRIDAERERVEILERRLEEAKERAARGPNSSATWIYCARRLAR
jgi:hypothetical protein